jgi:hypothetical protein
MHGETIKISSHTSKFTIHTQTPNGHDRTYAYAVFVSHTITNLTRDSFHIQEAQYDLQVTGAIL